ncbi:hypothetical protein GCM10023213_19900 [Prosthecobacter algae]|uniref:Lambda family phage portal protein n=2 Tax=Prosthecobacter algae TaxID=1144682 RepID=A0ABP9P2I6_9BACT
MSTYSPMILGPDGRPAKFDQAQELTVEAAYGSFQGAQHSRDRGYVYVPTLDTLQEVDSWSHLELLKKSRFVYNSGGGLIHRGVDGVARMVCGMGLFPYPQAKKKDWNKRLRALWARKCESKNTFDLSQKFTCGAAQQGIIRNKIKDGDLAPVLARNEDGRLRCMFYEAHQIGQGSTRVDPSQRWHHGVRLGKHNAPVAYRILGKDSKGQQTTVDVPSDNVLFCATYERFGQVRGLTRFYPILNKVLDRGEIMAALTKGIKMRAQIGYAIEQELPNQVANPAGGRGVLAPRPTTTVEVNGKRLTLEQFFGGGESMELQPGQTFKTVESDHPNENVREHLDNIVRDVAWALKYSPELLWNITQLGGANTRFIMADAQSQIETEQQELVDQFLGPWYIAWVRDMIEAGEIEDVEGWELHTWLLPKRLTVDFGRDGKLHIEQWKRGMITMKSLYGFVGDEWQLEIDQYLDERQYIKEGLQSRNLTWAEAFPEITSPDSVKAAQEAAEKADATDSMKQQLDDIHEAVCRATEKPPTRL